MIFTALITAAAAMAFGITFNRTLHTLSLSGGGGGVEWEMVVTRKFTNTTIPSPQAEISIMTCHRLYLFWKFVRVLSVIQHLLRRWYLRQQRVRVRVVIGVWFGVYRVYKIMSRIILGLGLGLGWVTFNVSVCHWSNIVREANIVLFVLRNIPPPPCPLIFFCLWLSDWEQDLLDF